MTQKAIRLAVEDEAEAAVLIAAIESALESADQLRAREALARWLRQIRSSPQAGPLAQSNVFDIATGGEHDSSDPVQRIFDHWRAVMQKPAARLDGKRRRIIRRRLDEGYSESELLAAVTGNSRSDWHQGANDEGRKYNDLTLILRDASRIEGFQELAEQPRSMPSTKPRSTFGAASRDAQTIAELEAFRKGEGE